MSSRVIRFLVSLLRRFSSDVLTGLTARRVINCWGRVTDSDPGTKAALSSVGRGTVCDGCASCAKFSSATPLTNEEMYRGEYVRPLAIRSRRWRLPLFLTKTSRASQSSRRHWMPRQACLVGIKRDGRDEHVKSAPHSRRSCRWNKAVDTELLTNAIN